MNSFNFKSSVCTSREQSERLLALGLKAETADCCYYYYDGEYLIAFAEDAKYPSDIPAQSLHRLLCLYGADYEIKEVYNNAEECYGMLICAIEIAIENGDFNEEYLER